MKKLDFKSLVVGFIIGTIGVSTVLATGGIQSAKYSSSKVYFYGEEVTLKNPLISVVKDGSTDAQLYMPMRELLEYMNFNVKWNSKNKSINLTMKGDNNDNNAKVSSDISANEADTEAIDTIQKTGNWKYIEKYIPHMSADGIKKVVEIYNSKHNDPSEHKKASDYIKK